MKKLSLQLDQLGVESFPTSAADGDARGTVDAAEKTLNTAECGSCGGETCGGVSCFTSCIPGSPLCTCPVGEDTSRCV
ncbi:hypothetical protein [Longimicrobium sp.]|uniref:hypothetical protein n=1 Tax=Longimicrobium sp. TaxID=2029185 RepID=UPI002C346EDC|nr:hypothetical protein [Longimicrobium sp.]HSU14856.1 hypothetical protein [Longimicrobium sp.]